MKNGNSEIKDKHHYEEIMHQSEEDIHYYEEDMNNKNRNFEFEFDIDKVNEYFINGIGNIQDGNYEEIYEKGFRDGYEKAKQEALNYLEKNKYSKKRKSMNVRKY